jgi:hypothetical protein
VYLSVVPEPVVNVSRNHFNCLVGQSLHIRLEMRNVLAFHLMHGGKDISHRRYRYLSENSTLVIFSLQLLDTGQWSVYAGNAVDVVTANFTVTIIDGQPTSSNVANQTQSSDESNVNLIIGITTGSFAVLALILVALVSLWLWNRKPSGNYKPDSKTPIDSVLLGNAS